MKVYRVEFERRAAYTGVPLWTLISAPSSRAARLKAESQFPEMGAVKSAVSVRI